MTDSSGGHAYRAELTVVGFALVVQHIVLGYLNQGE
jgi:hypothetical protein